MSASLAPLPPSAAPSPSAAPRRRRPAFLPPTSAAPLFLPRFRPSLCIRISHEAVKAMAATGGVSADDVPILQAENLTSNVKSIYYRSASLFLRPLPMRSIRSGGALSDLEVRLV